MKTRFSSEVTAMLVAAGWDGAQLRKVIVNEKLRPLLFPKAEEVLSEFFGLHFGETGTGVDFARSDMEIDPDLCVDLFEELRGYESQFGKRFFPLGVAVNGHLIVVLDEAGKVYALSDILEPCASSFDEAVEGFLLGVNKVGHQDHC